MNKRIYLNAVTISGPTASPGLWAHPEDRSYEYTSLKYWVELAQTLERGKFDAIFLLICSVCMMYIRAIWILRSVKRFRFR